MIGIGHVTLEIATVMLVVGIPGRKVLKDGTTDEMIHSEIVNSPLIGAGTGIKMGQEEIETERVLLRTGRFLSQEILKSMIGKNLWKKTS